MTKHRCRWSIGRSLFLTLAGLFLASHSYADQSSPQSITYEGRLYNAAGTAPLLDTVDFEFSIYDGATGTCLLYDEFQPNINIATTDGTFALTVGTTYPNAIRTAADPGFIMSDIFKNAGSLTVPLCAGGVYTPAAGESRRLRVIVTPHSIGVPETLTPDYITNSVPQALVAESIQGTDLTGLIVVNGTVTQANMLTLTAGPASDASNLHNHDSHNDARYARIGTASTQNFGSGNLTTTGDIGIGTSTPNADLDIERTNPDLRLGTTGGGTSTIQFYSNTSASTTASIQGSDSANTLTFSTGGTQAMEILQNQSVLFSSSIVSSATVGLGKYTSPEPFLPLTAGQEGTLWDNSTVHKVRYWDGTAAEYMASATSEGTAGQVLTSAGTGAPATWSAINDNTKVPLNGSVAMTGNLDLGTHQILNVTDPTAPQDAATQNYVDTHLATRTLSSVAPAVGNAMVWNGAQWAPTAVASTPGGVTTQVQFNNAGVFAGSAAPADFTWNDTSKEFTLSTTAPTGDAFAVPASPLGGGGGGNNSLVKLGATEISGGNTNGTYIGVNQGTATADFINYQVGGTTKFLVDKNGNVSANNFTGSGSSLTGVVTSVTGTAPISSSGGTTPAISIPVATSLQNGYLASGDWTTFNNKFSLPALTSGSVLFSNGTTIAQDNANFFYDSTNHRLGIGSGAPGNPLTINIPAHADGLAQALVYTNANGNKGLVVQETAGATKNFAEFQASTGTPLYTVEWTGTPSASTDLTNVGYVASATSTALSSYLKKDGSVALTGTWGAGNQAINNVSTLSVGTATAPTGGVATFNGNVGIGTSSPAANLDVVSTGATASTEYLVGRFENSANAQGISLSYFENGTATAAQEARIRSIGHIPLSLGTTTYPQALYILESSGNVGIGNTGPGALLDVGLAGTTLGTMRLEGNTSGYVQIQPSATAGSWTMTLPAAAPAGNGYLLSSTTAGVTSWVSPGGGGASLSALTNATGANTLTNGANSQTWNWNNAATSMTLANSGAGTTLAVTGGTGYAATFTGGNVGIGTTAPTEMLDVSATSGSAKVAVRRNGVYAMLASDGTVGSVGTTSNTDFQIRTNDTPKIYITSAGNVGIGNTGPGALLDVGLAGTTLGTMRLEGNTSGYVQIQPSATAGSWTMTLPAAAPAGNGYLLSSTTAGVTSWVSPGGGGASLSALTNATGANTLTNGANSQTWNWNNAATSMTLANSGAGTTLGVTGGTGYAATFTGGNVGVGTANPGAQLEVDSSGNAIIAENIKGPAAPSVNVWQVEDNSGTPQVYVDSGYVLHGNGSGLTGLGAGNLGTGTGATAPSISGDVTSGFYTAGAALVDVSISNAKVAEWSTAGQNLIGAYDLSGVNAIYFPADSTATGASIGIGPSALTKQSSLASTAFGNVAVGYQSMASASMTASAVNDTAMGYQALNKITSGNYSAGFGYQALGQATSTQASTAVGYQAGYAIKAGQQNTAIGYQAMANGGGSGPNNGNTAVGGRALIVTTGGGNTAIGANAGYTISSGSNNTILGQMVASTTLTSGSTNILIGGSSSVDTPAANTSNFLNIGNTIFATGTNAGTVASPSGKVGIDTTTPQAALDVNGGVAISGVLAISNTAPTVASGGCTGAAIGNANGTVAFTVNVGTACAGSQPIVLTMPAASNGWVCLGGHRNSNTGVPVQTTTATNSVTISNYAAGVLTAWTSSEILQFSCHAY